METNAEFWAHLDTLVQRHPIALDRPKGSCHPQYPDVRYAHDYGYLEGTASPDGEPVDVWLGSRAARRVDAVICTVDLQKSDCELKLLVGCTEAEIADIADFHNRWPQRRGLLVRRDAQA